MEAENPFMKETYIKLLSDISERKLQVLDKLLSFTQQQDKVIGAEVFNEEQFLQIIGEKDALIKDLNNLDQGFEQIYSNVKEELLLKRRQYVNEIKALQELITKITDRSVSIQALEKRNKAKLGLLLAGKRREIKKSRNLNKTAANYYKTMAQQHEQKSYFYDKKH